jgi:hypothetical protein
LRIRGVGRSRDEGAPLLGVGDNKARGAGEREGRSRGRARPGWCTAVVVGPCGGRAWFLWRAHGVFVAKRGVV